MATHPLLRLAHRFPTDEPRVDPYWQYRRDWGMWVESSNDERPMIGVKDQASPDQPRPQPRPEPPRPIPTSKKADRETGEDMKGA